MKLTSAQTNKILEYLWTKRVKVVKTSDSGLDIERDVEKGEFNKLVNKAFVEC